MASGAVLHVSRGTGLAVVTGAQPGGGGVRLRAPRFIAASARRQLLQVASHAAQIVGVEVLRAVRHHIGHAAERGGAFGAPGAQEVDQLVLGPAGQTRALVAQVLGVPALEYRTRQVGAFGAIAHGLFLECHAARRVACAAVRETLDKIGAALLRSVDRGIGDECPGLREQQLPPRQWPAQVQRPWDRGGLVALLDRLDRRHEIGVQTLDVAIGGNDVRNVRHRRIQRGAVGTHAAANGAFEIGVGVAADAALFVRRDVGRVDCAHRRLHRQPAREGPPAGGAVARRAVAGTRQVLALLDQRRIADIRCKSGDICVLCCREPMRRGDCDRERHHQQRQAAEHHELVGLHAVVFAVTRRAGGWGQRRESCAWLPGE